jgi:uncharacterized membrane protein
MAEENEGGDGPDLESLNGGGGGGALLSSLKNNKELLLPAALSAAGAVAVAKGPDLVRRLTSSTQQKGEEEAQRLGEKGAEGAKQALTKGGGLGGVAGKAASKLFGGGGGSKKKTRRLPIQRWTDVAVPVDRAYELWTKFDEFPKFMHRVLSVQKKGDDRVNWREKIWFSTREWEGRVTERRKNDRIAWKTTQGMQHYGVVSFHRISDNLTRVMVTMEFEPTGMMEKMASGMRFVKRAVQADLARFKAYAEMEDAKGLEYSAEKDKKGDDDKQGDKRQSKGESKSQDDARGRDNDDDDRDHDAEREERERRRQERREAVTQ